MRSWSVFIEQQKQSLIRFKDRFCSPLDKFLGDKLTPNFFTYLRILMAFGLYFLFILKVKYLLYWLVLLYLGAKFTDMIDGYLARARGRTSYWGEFIDLLADKVFYLVALLIFVDFWPEMLAFHYIFLVMSIVVIMVIINNFRTLFNKRMSKTVLMFQRLFEIIGYFVAIILLLTQLILE